jgi:hypothetical protein
MISRKRILTVFPRAAAVVAVAAALMTVSGCHAAPASFATANLADPLSLERAAPIYGKATTLPDVCAAADGLAAPETSTTGKGTAAAPARPRIAIAEFTVEFVTDKLDTPFKQQPVAGTTEYGYIGLPATLIGIGRRTVVYDDVLKRHLPDELYDVFVRQLAAGGLDVLPAATVAAAPAYKEFVTANPGSTKPGEIFNIMGSDTGRTKRLEYWPAKGLATLTHPTEGSFDTVERRLLAETDALTVLRVRVRVGVWRGYASVERETRIEVTAAHGAGHMVQQRSIVSDEMSIDESKWKLFRGSVYPVRTSSFAHAMEEVFTPDAAMAVDMLKCAGKPMGADGAK